MPGDAGLLLGEALSFRHVVRPLPCKSLGLLAAELQCLDIFEVATTGVRLHRGQGPVDDVAEKVGLQVGGQRLRRGSS